MTPSHVDTFAAAYDKQKVYDQLLGSSPQETHIKILEELKISCCIQLEQTKNGFRMQQTNLTLNLLSRFGEVFFSWGIRSTTIIDD